MSEASPTSERLAELIWRTIKLQISLLLAAAVLLLVIWSGLTNGNVEGTKVDVDFCNRLSSESTKALGKPIIECTTESARNFLEASRLFYEAMKPINSAFEKEKTAFLEEYDQKRKTAYRLEIGLSAEYGESKIIVNALSVAEVVPFVVTILFAIIVVLGFQQTAYRFHLRKLLTAIDSQEKIGLAIASNQFFSGFDLTKSRKAQSWFTIAPELLAIWPLGAGVCYLQFAVLSAFIGNLVHVTNSIFWNYVCALYTATFVLAVAVWLTYAAYHQNAHDVARPKGSIKSPFLATWLTNSSLTYGLSGIAVLSLFLPWTISMGKIGVLKGYSFLLKQSPVFQTAFHTQYPVDPTILLEIRVQLAIVGLFIVSCILRWLLAEKPGRTWKAALKVANQLLAVVTLFLSLNYLLYMAMLQWWTGVDTSLVASSFNSSGGFPMNWYDPSYGFVIFLFCCLALVVLSLREPVTSKP